MKHKGNWDYLSPTGMLGHGESHTFPARSIPCSKHQGITQKSLQRKFQTTLSTRRMKQINCCTTQNTTMIRLTLVTRNFWQVHDCECTDDASPSRDIACIRAFSTNACNNSHVTIVCNIDTSNNPISPSWSSFWILLALHTQNNIEWAIIEAHVLYTKSC